MSSSTVLIPALFGHEPAESQALGVGVRLGHEHAEHAVRPQRPGAEGGGHAAVDAARYPEHRAPAAEAARDLLADRLRDPGGGPLRVDPEHVRPEAGWPVGSLSVATESWAMNSR